MHPLNSKSTVLHSYSSSSCSRSRGFLTGSWVGKKMISEYALFTLLPAPVSMEGQLVTEELGQLQLALELVLVVLALVSPKKRPR